ncbi:hypothetical protein AC579_1576 [Pseudocercospora musae]|uniref:Uncharacterized protein n=1 Tax=Pseudocercospora musae TaxID=113226 RepID=A0A139I201_9PEZI|nr:hypothetical protein AC579_1576 [Pseudocercospora musae]
MPFGHHHSNQQQRPPQHSLGAGLYNAASALGSPAAPSLQRIASGSTSAGTDAFIPQPNEPSAYSQNVSAPQAARVGGLEQAAAAAAPFSAPVSAIPDPSQQYQTPRRTHTEHRDEDIRGQLLQQTYKDPYSPSVGPSFSFQQATPQGSAYVPTVIPSNAGSSGALPGALQPAGGSRPTVSTSHTAPTTVPIMQQQSPPLHTNASQYAQTQPLARQNTLHSHSRSSPGGLDVGQKYIPFNQTPTQTPTTSNPKAYNISNAQTPSAGPSHSPLNLTDIRSRAISDANEGASGTAFFSYSDQPTNSNYLAPFPTYAFDWCKWPVVNGSSGAGKMAVGSYLEDPHNFIQILDTHIVPQDVSTPGQAPYGLEYSKVAEATCAYPVTRILWEPPSSQKSSTDLLATSGDHLRLWSLPSPSTPHSAHINRSASANTRDPAPQKLQPLALLSNSKTPEHTAPLTSLDWNTLSPKLIITSSIDTTCTIWDIPTLTAKTQLIAHDKEVFDVRFCAGSVDVFVSCGADGSVRMFDLRSLEHSTIIYEPAEKADKTASPTATSPSKGGQTLSSAPPLLRLAASPHDAHLLATFASDSNVIRILDVRQPGQAVLELKGHKGNLNSIEWNPSRRGMLASGADDSLVMVWDLLNSQNQASVATSAMNGNGSGQAESGKGPFASWKCEYEVANVSWAPQSTLTQQGGDWLGVCAGRGVWGVKL